MGEDAAHDDAPDQSLHGFASLLLEKISTCALHETAEGDVRGAGGFTCSALEAAVEVLLYAGSEVNAAFVQGPHEVETAAR